MLLTFLTGDLSHSLWRVIGVKVSFRDSVIPEHPELLGIDDLFFENHDCFGVRDYKTSRSQWHQGNTESLSTQLMMYAKLQWHYPRTSDDRHIHDEAVFISKVVLA